MALMITAHNELMEVRGHLNAQNMNSLSRHLDLTKNYKDHLILSLDRLESIDPLCTKILEQVYLQAASSNKVLTIIGRQNDSVKRTMQQTRTSYILSNDLI
jgi:anti-anti-sigma regulatory factor